MLMNKLLHLLPKSVLDERPQYRGGFGLDHKSGNLVRTSVGFFICSYTGRLVGELFIMKSPLSLRMKGED